ncbi:enolase-like [Populus alba]|uniref:enolase-like n=1 Tax=Populus alba TaxID=43335 RepID=UPI003CC7664F
MMLKPFALKIIMDVAASEFYNNDDNTYDLNFKEENNDGSQKISGDSLKNVYKSFVTDYPIVSIEDPFDQNDWKHHAKMTSEIGEQVQFVGDDLLVTNPKRVEKAIKENTCNAGATKSKLFCPLFHDLSGESNWFCD